MSIKLQVDMCSERLEGFCACLVFFAVVDFEFKALYILSKCSATELPS
jgi:hypothetical protein